MTIVYDILFFLIIILAAGFDFRTRRIPNAVNFCVIFPLIGKMFAKVTETSGSWERLKWICIDMVGGMAIALLFTGIPYIVNKSVGGGDVKLAFMSGFYTGAQGALIVLCTAFLLCALAALAIMAIRRRKIAAMPFAPFMLAGTIHFLLFSYLP